jgi:hypothetical protein
MKDKFSVEMMIVKLLRKYADYWRYVFFQDIAAPITVDTEKTVCLDAMDIDKQREMVGRIGHLGYSQKREGGGMLVSYAHPSRPPCLVLSD